MNRDGQVSKFTSGAQEDCAFPLPALPQPRTAGLAWPFPVKVTAPRAEPSVAWLLQWLEINQAHGWLLGRVPCVGAGGRLCVGAVRGALRSRAGFPLRCSVALGGSRAACGEAAACEPGQRSGLEKAGRLGGEEHGGVHAAFLGRQLPPSGC